jgi:polar amino acid transport system ATP-binding protein
MSTAKISLRGVQKAFGAHSVLNGIDMEIAEGTVVSLIGPSGSGKSTLLRCINLLEPIDDGEIFLDGTDISVPGFDANPVRRRIGMVFQNFNLFPHMSVQDNITLSPVRTLGVNKALAHTKALELLERFGLADKVNAFPDQLSGGQQQRVAIVRASSLDPELVSEVLDVVRELKTSGMTLVLATHEMGFARDISDLVCMLDGGHIIEQGQPDQVFSAPKSERAQQFLERIIRAGRL